MDLTGAQQFETQFITLPLRLSFEGLEIRMAQRQVLLDGEEIILTELEYLVLCHLARHSSWVQSKRQIFEAVWPPETEADYHTVEVAIYTLRKKLDPDTANPRFIKTVPVMATVLSEKGLHRKSTFPLFLRKVCFFI